MGMSFAPALALREGDRKKLGDLSLNQTVKGLH
jgi:hypothetical protein